MKDQMDDIQRSELVISKILSLLMEWGIKECELKFEELDLDESFATFFFPCVYWLEAEGVIRAREIVQYSGPSAAAGLVNKPVLTSYGMRMLAADTNLLGT